MPVKFSGQNDSHIFKLNQTLAFLIQGDILQGIMRIFDLNFSKRGGKERLEGVPSNKETESVLAKNRLSILEDGVKKEAARINQRLLADRYINVLSVVRNDLESVNSRAGLERMIEINLDTKLHNSVPQLVFDEVISSLEKGGKSFSLDLVNQALLEVKIKARK